MAGLKSIKELHSRLSELKDNLDSGIIIRDIINDGYTTAFIIDANAEDQLFEQGINRLGVSIMDYEPYSPMTISIKQKKGQPTNLVTLRDEGDFESSFYLEVGDRQFEVKAGDWKTEELIKKYGRYILGLTNENIAILIWQYIYPDLLEKVNKKIYGNG